MTNAASDLHLTPSAVSHQLKAIETRIGAALFRRGPRGMSPTPLGEALAGRAAELLPALAATEIDLVRGAAERVQRLRFSTGCYTAYQWLPKTLAELHRGLPELELEIAVEHTRRPLDAVASGAIDVALVAEAPQGDEWVCVPLFEDELVALMAPGDELAKRRRVRPEDFADQVLFAYSVDPSESFVVGEILEPVGVCPRRLIGVPLTEAIVELVAAGRGVAVLASWAVRRELSLGALVARPLAPRVCRTWTIVGRAGSEAAQHLVTLAEAMKKSLRPMLRVAHVRHGSLSE